MRNDYEALKRDRRPMVFLLSAIAAVAATISIIAYSGPERADQARVATTQLQGR